MDNNLFNPLDLSLDKKSLPLSSRVSLKESDYTIGSMPFCYLAIQVGSSNKTYKIPVEAALALASSHVYRLLKDETFGAMLMREQDALRRRAASGLGPSKGQGEIDAQRARERVITASQRSAIADLAARFQSADSSLSNYEAWVLARLKLVGRQE